LIFGKGGNNMADTWVDFKAVKAAVTLQAVLDRYGINWLRKSKDELRGRCPIHNGEGTDTFHVSISKNAFHCFSCKKRGNVLDFVAAMEDCSIREAAVKLAEWFSVVQQRGGGEGTVRASLPSPAPVARPEEMVNKPLTFQLKGVDPSHPYLASRGISRETAETFGAGYFPGKGSMAGRIVIPIHDEHGHLVAYAGRSIDNTEPKYKLPPGFRKSAVLFNLHRVTAREVIVVEGFMDCMKVWQSLHPFVVALMGCSLSQQQEELLVERFKQVTLLLDGDAAGRQAAEELAQRLVRKLWVKIAEVPDGRQPDELSEEAVDRLLA
jgi:DNA primase